MNLEEFYQAKNKLEAPKDLSFLEEREWFRTQIRELQDKLSKEDLKIVLERNTDWQRKLQSSH